MIKIRTAIIKKMQWNLHCAAILGVPLRLPKRWPLNSCNGASSLISINIRNILTFWIKPDGSSIIGPQSVITYYLGLYFRSLYGLKIKPN